MVSLRSFRRMWRSSEKCPINSRYNYLDHSCHYFHLNMFLDVCLEIELILWNVILGALRNRDPGRKRHPTAKASGLAGW